MDYAEMFDVITLIYCDYGALTYKERQTILAKVFRALKSGGRFIFDVFTEKTQKDKQDKTSWSFSKNGGFWNGGPHICLEAEYYFENNTVKVNKYIVITENNINEYLIWDTVFTKQTLLNEVLPLGFQTYSFYADVCGSPHTGQADTLCLMLKKE